MTDLAVDSAAVLTVYSQMLSESNHKLAMTQAALTDSQAEVARLTKAATAPVEP